MRYVGVDEVVVKVSGLDFVVALKQYAVANRAARLRIELVGVGKTETAADECRSFAGNIRRKRPGVTQADDVVVVADCGRGRQLQADSRWRRERCERRLALAQCAPEFGFAPATSRRR